MALERSQRIFKLFVILICIGSLGCEDPIEAPVIPQFFNSDGIFNVSFTANGQDYKFTVNPDSSLYMSTYIDSRRPFNFASTVKIPEFVALFDDDRITSTEQAVLQDKLENSMRIGFSFPEDIFNGALTDNFLAFQPGDKFYLSENNFDDTSEMTFELSSIQEGMSAQSSWNFGDGKSINTELAIDTIIHVYPDRNAYTAEIISTFDGGINTSNKMFVNIENRIKSLFTNINYRMTDATTLELSAIGALVGLPKWNGSIEGEKFSVPLDGSNQNICVEVGDGEGNISETCIVVSGSNENDVRVYGFNIFQFPSTVSFELNSVQIEFFGLFTPSPETHASRNLQQPDDSYFRMSNIELFDNDDIGNRTVKMDLEFQCTIWEDKFGNNEIKIENGRGTIAFALPD